MEVADRAHDGRQQQTNLTGSTAGRRSDSSQTIWQTPVLSAKFKNRIAYEAGVAGGWDPAANSADSTAEFIAASCTSSFQPIRAHENIPTAHVMPSTQTNQLCNPRLRGVLSPGLIGPSTTLAQPSQPRAQNGTSREAAPSETLSLEAFAALKVGDYGLENSLSADLLKEDSRKFNIPNIEPTLNQTALQDVFSNETRFCNQIYKQSALPAEMAKEMHQALSQGRLVLNGGMDCSAQPSNSTAVPLGFQHNIGYSKQTAPVTQTWRQESCLLQPGVAREWAAWQQQPENIRVKMEQIQGRDIAAYHQPVAYGAAGHHNVEPRHWENLLKSSETLLKDKDMLVERQKQYISQLEQKMRESELQMHSALLGRPAPYGDIYMLKLQEVQRENTFLRAQFAEQFEAFNKERADLEQKLAVLEAGTTVSSETLKNAAEKHEQELKKQEERVKGRDKHINNLKKKYQKESEQSHEKQQRIETLERYLAGLPTQDDHRKQTKQLEELRIRCADLQEKALDLERSLVDAHKSCLIKDDQLQTERSRGQELFKTMQSLQEKLGSLEEGDAAEHLTQVNEDLKQECQSMNQELEYLKKVVNSQKRKMEQLSLQLKDMKKQTIPDDATEHVASEELRQRDEELCQLRQAIKELSSQNQDLVERNLLLQEQLGKQDNEAMPSEQAAQILLQLYRDLLWCLQDLQSVCSTITQRAQGTDPNLSLILGIHSAPPDLNESENLQNAEVVARKLAEVKQLHKDIVDLRTSISDRYASEMGDNCVTQ